MEQNRERKHETVRFKILEELDRCPIENTRRRDSLLKMLLKAEELTWKKARVRKQGTGETMKKKAATMGWHNVNPGLAKIKKQEEEKEQ